MTGPAREILKAIAFAAAVVAVIPALVSFRVRAIILGPDQALMGSTQALGLIPGMLGQYIRRAFLSRVLAHCAPTAVIEWGAIFSAVGTRLDDYVYIGPNCHIGLVHFEHDVLLGPSVHVPSGRLTHGLEDPDQPLRNQEGERHCINIGANSWIGSGSVVMADVGAATIIGAGSVVTKPIPGRVVAAGVPAHVIHGRDEARTPPTPSDR